MQKYNGIGGVKTQGKSDATFNKTSRRKGEVGVKEVMVHMGSEEGRAPCLARIKQGKGKGNKEPWWVRGKDYVQESRVARSQEGKRGGESGLEKVNKRIS